MSTPVKIRPTAAPAPAQPVGTPTRTPERTPGRPRTAAAERAYARRAQREGRAAPARATAADSTAGRASFVVLIIVLLAVGVAATLWLSTQAIADSYRLENAKKETAQLAEQADALQREVTKQESASSLAQRAHDLGMVPAGDKATIKVGADGKVVVVGDPKPAQAPAPIVAPVDQTQPAQTAQSTQTAQPSQPTPPADAQAQPPAAGGN